MTSGTSMSALAANNLFNVNGIVAVITGGGSGESLNTLTLSSIG